MGSAASESCNFLFSLAICCLLSWSFFSSNSAVACMKHV
jgi:hypothetical protein